MFEIMTSELVRAVKPLFVMNQMQLGLDKEGSKTSAAAYYTDNEYKKNIAKIKADFAAIKKARKDYDTVYSFPASEKAAPNWKRKHLKPMWLKSNLPNSVKMSCPPATKT